jgi:quercetin dioxygenase-like cupin family protein
MSEAHSFSYTRLYAGADGESHFEDVTLPAQAQGAVFVAEPIALSSMIMRDVIGTGPDAVPHNAPRRQFIVHLEGSVEVEASDGERRVFGPGDVVLVEDLEGRGHVTRWLGDGGARRTLFLPAPAQ